MTKISMTRSVNKVSASGGSPRLCFESTYMSSSTCARDSGAPHPRPKKHVAQRFCIEIISGPQEQTLRGPNPEEGAAR